MTSGNNGEGTSRDRPVERSVKLAMRDGWVRVLEGDGIHGKVVSLVLLVLLAIGSGLLLGPKGHQAIPYDADDLGSFAVGTVKAHRNYRIEDLESTEHKRREARENVLAVYDYDVEAVDRVVRRVREAFGFMQDVWKDHQLSIADEVERDTSDLIDAVVGEGDESHARDDGDAAEEGSQEQGSSAEEALADEIDLTAHRPRVEIFEEHQGAFLQRLQASLDEHSFGALAEKRFSSEIEGAVIHLVRHGMSRPIVADQRLLTIDRMRGLVLRPVPVRDVRNERVIRDVGGKVHDLETARAFLNEELVEVLPEGTQSERAIAGRLARRLVRPTVVFNRDETERRRDEAEANVRTTFIELEAGEKIIGDGERIELRHLVIFEGIRDQVDSSSTMNAHVGAGLLAILVALSLLGFSRTGVWRFTPSRKDLLFLLTVLLGTLLAVRGGMFLADALADRMAGVSGPMLYFALPAAAGIVLVRLVLSGEGTLVFAMALAVLVGVVADNEVSYAAFTFIGGIVAAQLVGRARDRGGIWQAGLLMAMVNVLVVAAFALQQGRDLAEYYPALISAFVAGAITPVLVLGLAILVENVFRYTTDLKLLELANMNNALLKELVVAAPGTYHHSMMIGTMVEAAAEAIGANPLFARVGAYYHDIGKGKNPLYFAENQKGDNPHDKLSPSMSALIIRRHVTDGVMMAKAAGLPQSLIDMIPMHHGTRLMGFFYHKAKEEAARRGDPPPSETDYRYAGPKPRFREAALLMIADSVEAAARSLNEPTTDRLRGMVQKVINGCFADGQFDECNITLKDLHAITRAFVTSLEAIHHTRPEYNQPADKSTDRLKNGDRPRQAKGGEKDTSLGKKTSKDARGTEANERKGARGGGTDAEESPPVGAGKRDAPVMVPGRDAERGGDESCRAQDASQVDGLASMPDGEGSEAPNSSEQDRSTVDDDLPASEGDVLKRLGTG